MKDAIEGGALSDAKELVFVTGGPVKLLIDMARELEEDGHAVGVDFHRNECGTITGFALIPLEAA